MNKLLNLNMNKLIFIVTSIPACRKTLRAGKNHRYFDFKNLKIYAHRNISYKFCKLHSVATPEHLEPFSLGYHVRIVAVTPDLQRVSFHSITNLLHHSSTTKRIPSLIIVKESIRDRKPPHCAGDRQQACGCCGVQIYARSPRRSVPRIEASDDLGGEQLARVIMFTMKSYLCNLA